MKKEIKPEQPELNLEDFGLSSTEADHFSANPAIFNAFQTSIQTTTQLEEQLEHLSSFSEQVSNYEASIKEDEAEIQQLEARIKELQFNIQTAQDTLPIVTKVHQEREQSILEINQQIQHQQELQDALLAPFLPHEETTPPQEETTKTTQPIKTAVTVITEVLPKADLPIPTQPECPIELKKDLLEDAGDAELTPQLRTWEQVFQMPKEDYKKIIAGYQRAMKALAETLPEFQSFHHPKKAKNKYEYFKMLETAYPLTVEQLNQVFDPSDGRTRRPAEKILSLVYRVYFDKFIQADKFTKATKAIRDPEQPYLEHLKPKDTKNGIHLADVLSIKAYQPETKPKTKPEQTIYKADKPIELPSPPKLTLEKPKKFPNQDQEIIQLMSYTIDCLLKAVAATDTPGIDWPIVSSQISSIAQMKATYVDGVIDNKELIKPDRTPKGYANLELIDVIKLISLRQYWGSYKRIPKKVNQKLLNQFDDQVQPAIDHFVACKKQSEPSYQAPSWLK